MVNQSGTLREMALFAGAGGGILGGHLLGWKTVCAVEWEPYPACVLVARQNDKILPPFPIWDDVQTFDGRPWRGLVDVVSGGFPCQDISSAGRGAGIDGERSGMWREMFRVVCEVRPFEVYVENSPMLTIRGLGAVLRDLASVGYDAKWGVLSCRDVGGVHIRERIWIVATDTKVMHCNGGSNNRKNSSIQKPEPRDGIGQVDASNNWSERREGGKQGQIFRFSCFPWGEDVRGVEDLRNRPDLPEPLVRRINNDVAAGVDRLKAIGNGQVPRVAATAFRLLAGQKVIP
jgi:DNA (cytosine-5)-methyltransferase 1